jgi:hypothetical protein
LAVGLIGLAACGGSDSSSRNRNSSTVTNVKRYEGTISVTSGGSDSLSSTDDEYKVSFDLDLDTVSSQPLTTGEDWGRGDFRNSISNLAIEKSTDGQSSPDISDLNWAQCPFDATFYNGTANKNSSFNVTFVEAPNSDIANAPCGKPKENTTYHQSGLFDSNGEFVSPKEGARYLNFYFYRNSLIDLGADESAPLSSILPQGIDPYFTKANYYAGVNVWPTGSDFRTRLNLSSTKLKDYQPFELTATPQAGTIDLNWKRSVDLVDKDVVTYDLLWSTDNFASNQRVPLEDVTSYSLPACLVNPANDLAADTTISLQLVAKNNADISSPALEQSVAMSADTVKCPSADPLAVPTDFKVVGSKDKITANWTTIQNPDPSTELYYCVSELNPKPADSTSENWVDEQESVMVSCSTEATTRIYGIVYNSASETKYFVQAVSQSGKLSERSEIQTIPTPKTENVSGLTVTAGENGLNVKWNPSGYKSIDEVDVFFAVNTDMACSDDLFRDLFKDEESIDTAGSRVGAVLNTESYFLSNDRLGEAYVPGAVVTVCAKRFVWGLWGAASDWVSATYTNPLATTDTAPAGTDAPKATEAPAVTLAPVVEETAKTAIVTSTATEVQLPAAAVEVSINVADVYTGFGVSASDVKAVEYQVSGGSWTAVAGSTSVKIPKAASKVAVRVTKTNGEEVVSEKEIVRTEESTDTTVAESETTMAPADTTAPVTTEAPASSDSSSSNNTLVYILGFIIVAGAAAFFFKKKSASTK